MQRKYKFTAVISVLLFIGACSSTSHSIKYAQQKSVNQCNRSIEYILKLPNQGSARHAHVNAERAIKCIRALSFPSSQRGLVRSAISRAKLIKKTPRGRLNELLNSPPFMTAKMRIANMQQTLKQLQRENQLIKNSLDSAEQDKKLLIKKLGYEQKSADGKKFIISTEGI